MTFATESGRRLKAVREVLKASDPIGWTMKGVCARLPGLTISALGNYEKGVRQIPPEWAVKLAELYGVSAAYLMGLEDGLQELSQEERMLLERYRQADERGKRTIQNIAQFQHNQQNDNEKDRLTN